MLHKILMLGSESRGEVAVDIQLSYHFSINKYWHYDFRLGFQGTRQIARILADIVDHDGLTAGRCRTANSLIERNARVRRRGALRSLASDTEARSAISMTRSWK